MPGWRPVHVGFEDDDLIIGGTRVWDHQFWRQSGPSIQLPHPAHPQQMHRYEIYELPGEPAIRFAAGELSNGVWGFYVPD